MSVIYITEPTVLLKNVTVCFKIGKERVVNRKELDEIVTFIKTNLTNVHKTIVISRIIKF